MTLKDSKLSTRTCWDKKYQLLAIDLIDDKYTG